MQIPYCRKGLKIICVIEIHSFTTACMISTKRISCFLSPLKLVSRDVLPSSCLFIVSSNFRPICNTFCHIRAFAQAVSYSSCVFTLPSLTVRLRVYVFGSRTPSCPECAVIAGQCVCLGDWLTSSPFSPPPNPGHVCSGKLTLQSTCAPRHSDTA